MAEIWRVGHELRLIHIQQTFSMWIPRRATIMNWRAVFRDASWVGTQKMEPSKECIHIPIPEKYLNLRDRRKHL